MINLGRIGMVIKGEWNSTFTYNRLDVVTYGGGSSVSLVDNNNNKLPTDTAYWLQIAEKGETGNIDNLEDWHIVDALGYTPANKAVVDAHKAESVTQNLYATRDLTIVGIQTISTLPNRDIKGIIVSVCVGASKKWSILFCSPLSGQTGYYVDGTTGSYYAGAGIDISQDARANRTRGIIKNLQKGSFDIEWKVYAGTGATGTVEMTLFIMYHD